MTDAREEIRLVIWDLDGTFWRGTLTEGGIDYVQENHDLVIELARRGIMNSICSINDHAAVKTLLTDKGLWDYFILPSIDWSPKPRRIKAIIEAARLRARSVLFIDDTPSQRAAAARFVEGLRVEDEAFIANIHHNPLFAGKDDCGLTRLAQYRMIEERLADQRRGGGNNDAFLRASGIKVTIDTDIAGNIERAVELINRTNQLNFTKNRLPGDGEAAAAALARQLQPFYAQSGLVRVHDRYGDYGYCGFYLVMARRLVHFCFSCRILGFGVEHFVYERLKRPSLDIVGDVVSDPRAPRLVDWINAEAPRRARPATRQGGQGVRSVRLRGACEMSILEHYFLFDTEHVKFEGNHGQNRLTLRGDSLLNLGNGIGGQVDAVAGELMKLGFPESGIASRFFASLVTRNEALIMFCDADFWMKIYRHRKLGFLVNFQLDDFPGDLCAATEDAISAHLGKFDDPAAVTQDILTKWRLIRRDYECPGEAGDEVAHAARTALETVLARVPADSKLFVITPHIFHRLAGGLVENQAALRFNEMAAAAAADAPHAVILNLGDFIESDDEILDHRHYSRIVYYRLYGRIKSGMTDDRAIETIRFGA